MNWQAVIQTLISHLKPVFETWFTDWLESVLPTVAARLPAPTSGILGAVSINQLLLLHEARSTLRWWNLAKLSEIDGALNYLKTGSQYL